MRRVGVGTAGLFFMLSCACAAERSAWGAYLLTPLVSGQSTATAAPGSSFTMELLLSTDTQDQHDACDFYLTFSAPGLVVTAFEWGAPYSQQFDLSTPGAAQLPAIMTADLLQGGANPNDVVDAEFSNLTDSGFFASGVLLSVDVQVPLAWSGPGVVEIQAVPELFTAGFANVSAITGAALSISIPAPTSGCMLVALMAGAFRRRARFKK